MSDSSSGNHETCPTIGLGLVGYLFDTAVIGGMLIYVVRKRLELPGETPDWGRPYRQIHSGLMVALLNSLPALIIIVAFHFLSKNIFAQQDIAACNVCIAFFVPLIILVRPFGTLFFHKTERLLPVAQALADRIRRYEAEGSLRGETSVNATRAAGGRGSFRVLLVGSWGRGYFTHQIMNLLKGEAGGDQDDPIALDMIHFDDEEDACIRRNLELSASSATKVHLAKLDDGIECCRGGRVWWSQFERSSIDVVILLPKIGQSYPVKPTTMTPDDMRAARMSLILVEASRVVRHDGGRIIHADEPNGALTTLADFTLASHGAITEETAIITDDGVVKIGHISARYDSRCIMIEVEGSRIGYDTFPAGDRLVSIASSSMASFDADTSRLLRDNGSESAALHRDRVLNLFHFQLCFLLDWILFAAALNGGMQLFDITSVPESIPRDLRFGTLFPMWAQMYPVASFMLRWRECDIRRYNRSTWSSLTGLAKLYGRSQLLAFGILIIFVVLVNVPFFAIAAAIGSDDVGLSLDALNTILKSIFWLGMTVWIVKNLKRFARLQLSDRGISDTTLAAFFD